MEKPIKRKYVCAVIGPFVTKALRKGIHTHFDLRNRYNKNKSQDTWNAFKRQRNRCIKMLHNANFGYYKTLDIKCLTDNRKFWITVKLFFSDKIQAPLNIALLENEILVTDDKEEAEIFKEYLVNITGSLRTFQPKDALQNIDGIHDLIEIAVKKYSSHPSVKLISLNKSSYFPSSSVTTNRVSPKHPGQ